MYFHKNPMKTGIFFLEIPNFLKKIRYITNIVLHFCLEY
ncbi:MAG: hypothetical protein BAJALOKI3v1_90051 [Promethearchaeota archaeon]|nr:MAG: hypothetical protein BAJALOKI3v1_90051 [Candidatus Lokiarchaeota archaeon]